MELRINSIRLHTSSSWTTLAIAAILKQNNSYPVFLEYMLLSKLPDPGKGKGKNQISAPWGQSIKSKATSLSKSPPTHAPPPLPSPGITLIGALLIDHTERPAAHTQQKLTQEVSPHPPPPPPPFRASIVFRFLDLFSHNRKKWNYQRLVPLEQVAILECAGCGMYFTEYFEL